jgi:hypothetical protein
MRITDWARRLWLILFALLYWCTDGFVSKGQKYRGMAAPGGSYLPVMVARHRSRALCERDSPCRPGRGVRQGLASDQILHGTAARSAGVEAPIRHLDSCRGRSLGSSIRVALAACVGGPGPRDGSP